MPPCADGKMGRMTPANGSRGGSVESSALKRKVTAMKATACRLGIVALTSVAVMVLAMGCDLRPGAEQGAPAVKPAKAAPGAFEAFKKKSSVPVLYVPLVSKAPKIDAKLDPAYEKATPVNFKFTAGGDAKPAAKTTAYVVSTKKKLYMYFVCESPDMDALLADVRKRDGQVWNDDCIELFIDPTNKRQLDGYVHIMVNSIPVTAECKGPAGAEDYSWNPKIEAKTDKTKKAWVLELAIPFADLVPDPSKINRVWAVNMNRMAYLLDGTEDTAWSPTESTSSHVPSKFGAFWLEVGNVDNTK